jgi:hypothetical protein
MQLRYYNIVITSFKIINIREKNKNSVLLNFKIKAKLVLIRDRRYLKLKKA